MILSMCIKSFFNLLQFVNFFSVSFFFVRDLPCKWVGVFINTSDSTGWHRCDR